MKKFFKMMVCLMALVVASVCCLGLAGCKDMKKLQINLQAYNYSSKEWEDKTLTVDMYRHLAPRTVDAMVENINNGIYNNTAFYTIQNYSDQFFMGDLVFKNNTLEQNVYVPRVEKGEFTNGGVVGSDLTHLKGSISLWRTWLAGDGYSNSNGANTGRGTWSFSTTANDGYNDKFCIFAKIETVGEQYIENVQAFQAIQDRVKDTTTSRTQIYVIYYTGEYVYDENITDDSAVRNNGLTYHCVTLEDYNNMSDAELDEIFVAEGDQYACYNKMEVRVPIVDKNAENWELAIKVVSYEWK